MNNSKLNIILKMSKTKKNCALALALMMILNFVFS